MYSSDNMRIRRSVISRAGAGTAVVTVGGAGVGGSRLFVVVITDNL